MIHIEKQVPVNLLKINLVETVTLFKIKNSNGLPIYIKIEQNIIIFFLKKVRCPDQESNQHLFSAWYDA